MSKEEENKQPFQELFEYLDRMGVVALFDQLSDITQIASKDAISSYKSQLKEAIEKEIEKLHKTIPEFNHNPLINANITGEVEGLKKALELIDNPIKE